MKFSFLFSLLIMLCCLVYSQGSNNNENTMGKEVNVEDEFAFEKPLAADSQDQQETPTAGKPTDEKYMKPGIAGFFERMIEGTKKNPLMLVCLLVVLLKNYLSSGKVEHIEGSLVRHINQVSEWNDLMDESKKEGKFVVVDFFATWCQPCRKAAPRFDQLSIDYGKDANVIFCKVDVDKCSSIAKNSGVTAMPTFMIVKDAKEVEKLKGWSEAGLKELLVRCGAKKGTASVAGIKKD